MVEDQDKYMEGHARLPIVPAQQAHEKNLLYFSLLLAALPYEEGL